MTENEWRDKIDDYLTSIQAIVGFANFYLWNATTRSGRSGVTVFQGRRLLKRKKAVEEVVKVEHDTNEAIQPTEIDIASVPTDGIVDRESGGEKVEAEEVDQQAESPVTPDLGIVIAESDGVLAEVKISFPQDEERWFNDFAQLMSYDEDFEGWPTQNKGVSRHDIVLITEQGRANKVKKFFEKYLGDKIQFTRPFIIVSCNRSDNRQQYYFFQRIVGKLSASEVDQQLEDGTKVPMKVLLAKYSTIKLYDAEPPLPYLMELIWTQVVLNSVRRDAKFPKLRKRQKVPVILDVDEIVLTIREGFTFRSLEAHASEGTPAMPRRSWVFNALEKMISLNEAEWIDASKKTIRVFFQMYDDALDHFIKGCLAHANESASPQPAQLPLKFPEE